MWLAAAIGCVWRGRRLTCPRAHSPELEGTGEGWNTVHALRPVGQISQVQTDIGHGDCQPEETIEEETERTVAAMPGTGLAMMKGRSGIPLQLSRNSDNQAWA